MRYLLASLMLFTGFAGLGIYHYLNRVRYQGNETLLHALQQTALPASADQGLGQPGDWPQWRGPFRDGLSRETGLLDSWPAQGPALIWQVSAGRGYSSMAVAEGRLVTQMQEDNHEVVLCLDAATGQERWRQAYLSEHTGDPTYGPSPRATPTIDGDRVYTVSGNGLLHCFEVATGKLRWHRNLLGEFQARLPQWGVACSPLIEGNLVIVHPGGPQGNSIAAFDKHSGQLVWKSHDDPPGYSSPVAATLAGQRQVLMFTGRTLVGLSPTTGAVYWRFPWLTTYDTNIATPIVRGDYVFISSDYGKGCALVKITSHERTFQAESVYESNEFCSHFSSGVLYGEHVYGFHVGNTQALVCLEFRTGRVVWSQRGFGQGTVLIADSKLIVLSENGYLSLADATPEGYRERASFRFSRKRCWTVPVLAQGKLFVRDEEKLACYALKPS